MGDYPTASQVLPVTNWPKDMAIRTYLFDIGRTKGPRLWVEVSGVRIYLDPQIFRIDKAHYYLWIIEGLVERSELRTWGQGFPFSLHVYMGPSKRQPVFTLHQIPLLENKQCECCDDGTILDITDEGHVCPNCNHPRSPIRLGSRPEVHGSYAGACDFCGASIAYTQGDKENLYCPSCGKSRPRE